MTSPERNPGIGAFQRILAGVDDSSRSADVLRTAADLARIAGGLIRLYHAVSVPQDFPPAAAMPSGDPLPAYLHGKATERLTALASSVEGVRCEIHISDSFSPWRAILEAAKEFEADLIVIGSHRYDRLDRILGTTAANVVNFSTVDVLIVRSRQEA